MMIRKWAWVMVIFLGIGIPSAAFAAPPVTSDSAALRALESLPAQHGGRIKPLRSFAEEAVLYITGRAHWDGYDPVGLIFSWMANPSAWRQSPVLKVAYEPLREKLGLRVIDSRISVENVLDTRDFAAKGREYEAKQSRSEKLTTMEQKHLDLYSRASYLQALLQAHVPGMIANPAQPEGGWYPFAFLQNPEGLATLNRVYGEEDVAALSTKWEELLEKLRNPDDAESLRETSVSFTAAMGNLFNSRKVVIDRGILDKELFYHHFKPFHKAWMLYGLSLLVSLVALLVGGGKKESSVPGSILSWAAAGIFLAGIIVHTSGIYLRVVIAGRPPVSNMYESMIWVSWVTATFAFIYYLFNRSAFVLNWAAVVAGITLLLAQGFPVVFSPAIDTLVPVLRSNLWLTVHVLTITMSYGAFALAWGLGHGVITQAAFRRGTPEPNPKHVRYLHRVMMIGVALLAAGTILGGVWANYSWGRFWGWDPKETWALIALLGYVAVLHGRFAGWYGSFGLAAGAVISFLGVVMAWYGVNYVLAAGLHSYGFGGGGAKYVLSVAGLDLVYVALCIFVRKKRKAGAGLARV